MDSGCGRKSKEMDKEEEEQFHIIVDFIHI